MSNEYEKCKRLFRGTFHKLVNNRIGFLRHSFGHLIRHVINDGEMVGIVRFYKQCDVLQPLKEVKDKATREAFAKKVERFSLKFYTSIGCGLQLGIKVLESHGTLASGGTLILISDGIENGTPLIANVLPMVLAKGVIVHTFAIGPTADAKLQNVALQTGGTAYFFADNQKNIIASMGISFVLSTTSHLEDSQKPVFLVETTEDLDNKTPEKRIAFPIPEELGKDTRVTVSTTKKQAFNVYVLDPTGKKCNQECSTTRLGDLIVEVTIPETKKTETWTVILEKKSEPVKNLSVVVMTKQRRHEDAIRTESCIRHVESTNMIVIYSRVTKGGARVLKANVTATITLPEKDKTVFLPLHDSGKGADLKADDGEYAAYFTQYRSKGRYSVRTDVTLDTSAVLTISKPEKHTPPLGRWKAAKSIMEPGKICSSSEASTECKERIISKVMKFRPLFRDRSKDQSSPDDARIKMVAYAGAFQMRTQSDPKDLPPDRVRDLAVKDVNRTSGDVTVTISWTSTGANLDAGKATSLDLRSSLDLRELIYNFQEAKQLTTNSVLEGSLTPEDPYR
ncbi:calcium-activated chloride channel regulator 1-like [Ixodes scapularis]|uniref:calcium-activated chloride channel regulator 1-like n=1 Tax=Ixodes scapularis TaxID=6945 RepID=UPI001A9F545B|nr:calcium-activated chloride channel regulator 1-like [Ixodes scapularis]